MLKAIHKETGKLVSAFKLKGDVTWIGKENEEWISPYTEIDNWKFLKSKGINEVKVSFVKPFIRTKNNNEERVRAHFRIENTYAKPSPKNESEEHKLAKIGIYEDILDNNILIDNKKILDLFEIEDIDFEYHLSKSKFSKIADVIFKFKNKDEQYGKGIIFEVQLSNQNFENTEDRTFDRVIEGYSVCWLWHGMFDSNNKLKDKNIIIVPFLKAIEEYKDKKREELYKEINLYGQLIDKKIEYANKQFQKLNYELQKEYINQKNNIGNLYYEQHNKLINCSDKISQELSNKFLNNEEIKTTIKNSINYDYLYSLFNKNETEKIVKNINEKVFQEISKIINENIKSIINNSIELTENKIKETIKKTCSIIENDFKNLKIDGSFWMKCSECNKNTPYKMCEFKCGKPFCQECYSKFQEINKVKLNEQQKLW